jgi:hypothetical protein
VFQGKILSPFSELTCFQPTIKVIKGKIIREAVEIELHLNSMIREDSFSLSLSFRFEGM